MVSPSFNLLKRQHDGDEDSNVLTIRYSYYPQLDTLPNRCVLLSTTAVIELLVIVFLIGLFPHLKDLELHSDRWSRRKPAGDLTLVPPFVPPLRGRLTGRYSGRAGLAKTMIEVFGGVRFHHMDLFRMGGTQPLLYACANTLKILQLYATDLYGENFLSKDVQVLVNDFADRSSLRDYDLSRNKSLWQLKITAQSLIEALRDRAPATTSSSLRAILSTIKSPAFSDVLVVYHAHEFCNAVYNKDRRAELGEEDEWYYKQFDAFREMYKARDFRLVLRTWHVSDNSVQELERAVTAEKARGGLPLEILVTHTLRAH